MDHPRSEAPSASASLMEKEQLKTVLRGVLAFPVTPFTADGDVDLAAVAENLESLVDSGVSAIVAPSGTGEFFSLTPQECADVITATIKAVNGKKPVIAGVGFGPRVAAELAQHAEQQGAAGIMVMPPYYGRPDSQGLIAYYREVAAATSLGIMPYARDSALFSPQLVEQLAREVPGVVAFKDGRADVRLFQQIREHVNAALGADRLVWLSGAGDDLVGPYFAAGADGFTSSLACFWPEASVELFRLASTRDMAGLASYHERVVRPIYELRQRRPGFEVSVMKAAMELLGYRAGLPRAPLAQLSEADMSDLRNVLAQLDPPRRQVSAAVSS